MKHVLHLSDMHYSSDKAGKASKNEPKVSQARGVEPNSTSQLFDHKGQEPRLEGVKCILKICYFTFFFF